MRFFWQQDRYAHEISVRSDAIWLPVLLSVEGTPSDNWPASPPFQSLHIEQRDDGRTLALLVGMAGKSHWSASVEIDTVSQTVVFDVACRVRDCHAAWLGSTYQRPAAADRDNPHAVQFDLPQRFGVTTLHTLDARTQVTAQLPENHVPQTIRWDYHLRFGEIASVG